MKKLFTLISLLAFCLLAVNIEASPQRDVVKNSFSIVQSSDFTVAASYEIAQIQIVDLYQVTDLTYTINPLRPCVVNIGKSEPMETDYGNMLNSNSTYNQLNYHKLYLNPEKLNIYIGFKDVCIEKRYNYGTGCGGQGDNLSGGFDSDQSPKVHI